MADLLHVEGLCKAFGGLQAAVDVSVAVEPGELAAVIGPNGAGKSTVFNMIAGALRPDAGRIEFRDRDVTGWRPEQLARLGLARTFQNIRVLAGLSTRENVLVGMTQFAGAGVASTLLRLPGMRREQRAFDARASELLDLVGLGERAETRSGALPYGRRKMLELAMALATEPSLLLLDEPAAGLNDDERAELGALIRRVNASGVAVLLIEHDVAFVADLADTVTVLDFGQVVASGSPEAVLADRRVIEIYIGEEA